MSKSFWNRKKEIGDMVLTIHKADIAIIATWTAKAHNSFRNHTFCSLVLPYFIAEAQLLEAAEIVWRIRHQRAADS
jgi:hypothetical protein